MKETWMIVDGHYLLFQMYYGFPKPIYSVYPFPIHGVIGFIGTVRKLLLELMPTHILVVFDGETTNPRKEQDAQYKANRPDFSEVAKEDNPFSNLPLIQTILQQENIQYLETVNEEADDVIARYTQKQDADIYIVSGDRDYLQLVNDHVFVYMYRGKKSLCFTEEIVKQKYGVMPSQIALYKAMRGDPSDCIAGVRGFGPVTVAKLLQDYPTLEAIYQNIAAIPERIRIKLLENRALIEHNLSLIVLTQMGDLPKEQECLYHQNWQHRKTMEIVAQLWKEERISV